MTGDELRALRERFFPGDTKESRRLLGDLMGYVPDHIRHLETGNRKITIRTERALKKVMDAMRRLERTAARYTATPAAEPQKQDIFTHLIQPDEKNTTTPEETS
jgi:hypothetical protein